MREFIKALFMVCLLGKAGLKEYEEIGMIGVNLN
jgi:hypothetical protein